MVVETHIPKVVWPQKSLGSTRVGIGSDPSPNAPFSLLEPLGIEEGKTIEISKYTKMTDMKPAVGG